MNISDYSVSEIEISYSPRVSARDRIKVTGSQEIFEACRLFWPSTDHVEFFYVCYLNRSNQILGFHQIAKGGFTGTDVDVRVIFQVALKACACSIIALHNHPSSNLKPSDADIKVTQKIKEAGQLLDINLLDHMIVTSDKYFSFADEGLL